MVSCSLVSSIIADNSLHQIRVEVTMKTFVMCPKCCSIKLIDRSGTGVYWQPLTFDEAKALLVLETSELLGKLVERVELLKSPCNICKKGVTK